MRLVDNTYWREVTLFGSERTRAEMWFSQSHGWEWEVSHYDDSSGKWAVLDSGLEKSPQDALAQLADCVLELAHSWTPF